jgi:ribulose-5-phosphate 4-epimerase/fuculose-1-phosphate aldolase
MDRSAPAPVSPASIRDQVSAAEWDTRVALAACYRLVAHYNWTDLIFTHISARVPGGDEHFLLNPYGLFFHEVTASSLVKVDLDANIVLPNGYGVNEAGFTIHSAVHAARPDVGCVIHLHTADGAAVSAQSQGLLPLSQTALVALSSLGYHDYEGGALNHDERSRIAHDLGQCNAMFLRNHGTLAVGRDVAAAFLHMWYLERACSIQVRALAGNRDVVEASVDSQETVRRQFTGQADRLAALTWPGLIRMLDAKDRSYRD